MICPRCGTDNRDGARFCDECGMAFLHGGTGRLHAIPSPLDEPGAAVDMTADTADLPEADDETLSFEGRDAQPAIGSDALTLSGGAPADTFYIGAACPELADLAPASGDLAAPMAQKGPSETQEMPRVDGGADTQNKAYIAPDLGGKKKMKMPQGGAFARKGLLAAIIIAVLLILGAAGAFATYSLELWGGHKVPNVIGLKAEDATDKLEAAGFTVSQVLVRSDDVEGIVLRTDPEADSRAEAGSEVTIDVSCARTVPDVVGKPKDEALALLEEEGFENIEVIEQKSDEAAGTVLAVSPEAGVRSKAQAKITLTIAIPHIVPAVAGMSYEDACDALEAEGYAVSTAYVYTEEVAEGTIIGTDPAEGTELPSGSEVCINIAKSRAAEVAGYARSWFQAAKNYTIGSMSYELISVDGIEYLGDDSCSFTLTMRPFETHSWFGSQPETRYGNDQKINGTMKFSQGGELESIDPDMKRA